MPGHRARDRLAAVRLEIGESRLRVDLEAIIFVRRRAHQIDAGEVEPERAGERDAAGADGARQADRAELRLAALLLGVAIVDVGALDLGREGRAADDMDAHVDPVERALELDGAPAYPLEPVQ